MAIRNPAKRYFFIKSTSLRNAFRRLGNLMCGQPGDIFSPVFHSPDRYAPCFISIRFFRKSPRKPPKQEKHIRFSLISRIGCACRLSLPPAGYCRRALDLQLYNYPAGRVPFFTAACGFTVPRPRLCGSLRRRFHKDLPFPRKRGQRPAKSTCRCPGCSKPHPTEPYSSARLRSRIPGCSTPNWGRPSACPASVQP